MELKQLYTDLILEYNKDKSNKRKLECPTVHEHGHNPSCGDDIDIEVKIKDGVIEDLAYTGSGCAISQASTAMMAELLQGRTIPEALRLCRLFLDMIRGKVTEESELEVLEAEGRPGFLLLPVEYVETKCICDAPDRVSEAQRGTIA